MDVQTREVYKRVSAGTEMKGGAGRDVNTAGVCVYACVCTWFTFSRRTLAATLCRRLPNINASLPAHSAACKRSVQPPPPRPTFGPPLSGWQRGPGISALTARLNLISKVSTSCRRLLPSSQVKRFLSGITRSNPPARRQNSDFQFFLLIYSQDT